MNDQFRPLKNAFGRYATGVAVASCVSPAGTRAAITINSFASVSLEPPLVSWCLETRASTNETFMSAACFGISIVYADQREVSDYFAKFSVKEPSEDEFDQWDTGAPILKRHLAAFDCRVHARHEAGDHVIFIGEVVKFASHDGEPLIYFASQYQRREISE